jgi:hypothetical protein
MIYFDVRTTDHYDDVRNSQFIIGYSRKPTPFNSKRKAVIGAVIAIACFLGYVMLTASDVPDTKPTVEVWR